MALTTSNLVTRCETRFRDLNHEVISAAEWLSYLNDAYADVNAKYREWPWNFAAVTVATVAGTRTYTLATTEGLTVRSVFNTTNDFALSPLQGINQVHLDYPDDTTQETPISYRFKGSQLELWPTPDAIYSILVEYEGSPADLTTGGIDPLWPDRYRRALVEMALSRAYLDDGNMDWAKEHEMRGASIVDGMVNDLLSGTRTERFPGVPDDWFM